MYTFTFVLCCPFVDAAGAMNSLMPVKGHQHNLADQLWGWCFDIYVCEHNDDLYTRISCLHSLPISFRKSSCDFPLSWLPHLLFLAYFMMISMSIKLFAIFSSSYWTRAIFHLSCLQQPMIEVGLLACLIFVFWHKTSVTGKNMHTVGTVHNEIFEIV